MKTSQIDFSAYGDEELCASYLRINRQKYPENFAAAKAELSRRELPIPQRSLSGSGIDGYAALRGIDTLIDILGD